MYLLPSVIYARGRQSAPWELRAPVLRQRIQVVSSLANSLKQVNFR